eukprot:1452677-Alexandrium_andersonii.AAC.1
MARMALGSLAGGGSATAAHQRPPGAEGLRGSPASVHGSGGCARSAWARWPAPGPAPCACPR